VSLPVTLNTSGANRAKAPHTPIVEAGADHCRIAPPRCRRPRYTPLAPPLLYPA
jgi:hypothetical protein